MTSLRTIRGRSPGRNVALTISFDDERVRAIDQEPLADGHDLSVIAPGLIDAQVNGYAGLDVNGTEVTPETVIRLTELLAQIGVTTWMPTIVTASEESISNALEQISRARQQDAVARNAIPSVHVEGPFISDHDGPRGVHDISQIRSIDWREVVRWQRVGGLVGLVTVSPHSADAPAHIAKMRSLGVRVAIGHTHASPEQVARAVDAGASVSTHLGNGISTMLPRHPNIIWSQLAEDRLSAGLIGDGFHLPMETLEVMLRAKTVRRAFLVSDSTAIAGMPPGRFETAVGGTVDLDVNGRLSYVGTDLLAGAAISLPIGFKKVIAGTSLDLSHALPLVTASPARIMMGARRGLGQLRVGAPPDFVLLRSSGADIGSVLAVIQSGRTISASATERLADGEDDV